MADELAKAKDRILELERALADSEATCNRLILGKHDARLDDNEIIITRNLRISELEVELQREIAHRAKLVQDFELELHEVDQNLGVAMGYAPFEDPEAGVDTQEHTPATLSLEAAQRIVQLDETVNKLHADLIALDARVREREANQVDVAMYRQALDDQISLNSGSYPPRAFQGAPQSEWSRLITARDVNRWLDQILQSRAMSVYTAPVDPTGTNFHIYGAGGGGARPAPTTPAAFPTAMATTLGAIRTVADTNRAYETALEARDREARQDMRAENAAFNRDREPF